MPAIVWKLIDLVCVIAQPQLSHDDDNDNGDVVKYKRMLQIASPLLQFLRFYLKSK